MQRIASTLIVVLSFVAALTWACRSDTTTQPSVGLKLTVPARLNVGQQTGLRVFGPAPSGGTQEDTSVATWQVSPQSVGRIDGAGLFTALASGVALVTATVNGNAVNGSIHVMSPTDFHVSGTVRDSSGQPVSYATLTAVGTSNQVQAAADGTYQFSGLLGQVTVRVEFAGVSTDQTLDVEADVTGLDFSLAVHGGIVNISGSWTATFSAPAPCAAGLSAGLQQRVYTVTVTQASSPQPSFTFTSPLTVFPYSFMGTVTGNTLSLEVPDEIYYGQNDGGILERLVPGQWLDISGNMIVSPMTSPPASGIMAGAFDYYEVDPILTTLPGLAQPKVHCAGTINVTWTRPAVSTAARRR